MCAIVFVLIEFLSVPELCLLYQNHRFHNRYHQNVSIPQPIPIDFTIFHFNLLLPTSNFTFRFDVFIIVSFFFNSNFTILRYHSHFDDYNCYLFSGYCIIHSALNQFICLELGMQGAFLSRECCNRSADNTDRIINSVFHLKSADKTDRIINSVFHFRCRLICITSFERVILVFCDFCSSLSCVFLLILFVLNSKISF